MERSQLYEYNDLIVCRYLKFKKTPDDNVLANRKFTSYNHIKIIIRLYEYLLFSLNSAGNLTLFLTLGNNSYEKLLRHIILELNQECPNGLLLLGRSNKDKRYLCNIPRTKWSVQKKTLAIHKSLPSLTSVVRLRIIYFSYSESHSVNKWLL
jgi:hypothetical protein